MNDLIGMQRDRISWFKHGIAYHAKFTGFKTYPKIGKQRCWNKIIVFVYSNDRQDAIEEVKKAAGQYGYSDITIDKLVRV